MGQVALIGKDAKIFGVALSKEATSSMRSYRPEVWTLMTVFAIAGLVLAFGHVAEEVIEGDATKFNQTILLFFRNVNDVSNPILGGSRRTQRCQFLEQNGVETRRCVALAGQALHPNAVADQKMIKRAMHRLEEGAMISAILRVGQLRRGRIEPRIGPAIIVREHLENRPHDYCCIVLVNQRMSGKDTRRGKERTVFKKPATCGGKAIS